MKDQKSEELFKTSEFKPFFFFFFLCWVQFRINGMFVGAQWTKKERKKNLNIRIHFILFVICTFKSAWRQSAIFCDIKDSQIHNTYRLRFKSQIEALITLLHWTFNTRVSNPKIGRKRQIYIFFFTWQYVYKHIWEETSEGIETNLNTLNGSLFHFCECECV